MGTASRSSTCARCPRWTWRQSPRRCAGPAAAWWRTRRRCTGASGPRSRRASPSSASTTWRRRCCGWAASPPPIRRPGWRTTTCPIWTGSWTPSTVRSATEDAIMTELKEFKLPDVGEGLTEADIVAWHVKPGDQVEVNQIIVEIETAKAVVELPSPWDGTVARRLAEEGQTVDVGIPIIAIEVAGAGTAAVAADKTDDSERSVVPAPATADKPPERHAVLVGYGVKASSTTRRARRAAPQAPEEIQAPGARALAKPPVRRLAKDLGISLAGLAGTGPDGSITRDDVQRAAGGTQDRSEKEITENGSRPTTLAAVPKTASPAGEERIPVRGVRKHMAAAMVSSAFTAPHVTEFLQVDVTETMAAVRRVRALPEYADVRVSPLLFVARALLAAVARHPLINSAWDAGAEEIVVKHYVNLGIAVAAERGLIVPNIKDAGVLPLPELA